MSLVGIALPALRRVATVGSLGVLLMQLVFQLTDPKLCWACILAGCAAAGVICIGPETDRRVAWIPLGAFTTMLLVGGVSSALAPSATSSSVQKPLLVGHSVSELQLGLSRSSRLVLLTLPGCGYCDQAKAQLARIGAEFSEVNLRGVKNASPLVDRSFAPQLLVVEEGKVTQHFKGYAPSDYDKLGR